MQKTKLTKIVATLGPASESKDKISMLIDAGVNIFRFNTKHNTPEWHSEHIKLSQQIAKAKGTTIGTLLDLQGPEIRLNTRNGQDVPVTHGELLKIGSSFLDGVNVVISDPQIFPKIKIGDSLLIDDGFVETNVVKVGKDTITVECQNDSLIKDRKGINLPGINISFSSLIENDLKQLEINSQNNIDYIGLSFVRTSSDIQVLRTEINKRNMKAMVVAKIENQAALDNLDEIISEADAIMIARGDLGVEVPLEELAYWQNIIISKCQLAHKPVITATQMLESMINNPRPTRAEVTDVAHAIFEGTDAIMLSGESAEGKYPVRCVETMTRIALWNESHRPIKEVSNNEVDPTSTITNAVASIVLSSMEPKIHKVIVLTETGYTARALAKHRLSIPVIAVTNKLSTAKQLTLSYGITPLVMDLPKGLFVNIDEILPQMLKDKILKSGETIVIVHGQHWQKPGSTNSVSIITL